MDIRASRATHSVQPAYRPDIDGLRAVAVLSVVGFHAFPGDVKGGFIGVDIFFVISGFLIGSIILNDLQHNAFTFVGFYGRRIRRIFPALLVVLAASYSFGWFALLVGEYEQLSKHIAAAAGFVANIALWTESGYFDGSASTKPLLHMWSLGIEEQFYIAWPLMLWLAVKLRLNLLVVSTVIVLISFSLSAVASTYDPVSAFYMPQTRFWELLVGSTLAHVHLHGFHSTGVTGVDQIVRRGGEVLARLLGKQISVRDAFALLGACLIITGVLIIKKDYRFPWFWAVVPVFGACLIIVGGRNAWFNRVVLSNGMLIWIGLISYPLYLWHWPLLSFVRIIEGMTPHLYLRVTAIGCSVLLAWLTYRLVEQPLRFGKHAKAMTPVLAASMIGVCIIGAVTYLQSGLVFGKTIGPHDELRNAFNYSYHPLGRPNAATIMLLGDSHAEHLAPGLEREFGQGVADFTSPGCIPFEGVDRYDARFIRGSCALAMNSALETFVKSDSMMTIILSSMGPVYLDGTAFHVQDELRVVGQGVTLESRKDLTDPWEIYERGMRNTLSRLLKLNKRIIFVLDVPELGFHPTYCLDRPLRISPVKSPCAVPVSEYSSRISKYKSLVVSVLKDFPQVNLFDPADILCDRQWCWAMRDSKLLYRDMDHLSVDGSLYIAKALAPIIRGTTGS